MTWKTIYEKWTSYPNLDPVLKNQLDGIKDNEKLLEDSFYKSLEFGTGGMRGELGPGTNRMNFIRFGKLQKGWRNT